MTGLEQIRGLILAILLTLVLFASHAPQAVARLFRLAYDTKWKIGLKLWGIRTRRKHGKPTGAMPPFDYSPSLERMREINEKLAGLGKDVPI